MAMFSGRQLRPPPPNFGDMETLVDSSDAIRRSARISTRVNLKQAQASITVEHAPVASGTGQESTKLQRKSKLKLTRKRARHGNTEAKAPKRANGKLQVFMDIPLDVFIEIAKYLNPFNLILLSRVNKFFRQLFMSRQAIQVWRSALLNVPGLPPCPTGICEPQYAALLFTKNCSVCGRITSRGIDPVLLVRLCVGCCDKEAVDVKRVTDPTLVFASDELVPSERDTSRVWCLYREARAVRVKLDELVAAGNPEAMTRWIEERRKVVEDRSKDTELLREWIDEQDEEHQDELGQLKSARQEKIKARLVGMGWQEIDFKLEHSEPWRKAYWNALLYNTKPLGDKTWKRLLPQLLKYLETNRKRRLQMEERERREEREDEFNNWIEKLSYSQILVQATLADNSPTQPEQFVSTPSDSGGNAQPVVTKITSLNPWFKVAATWPEAKTTLEKDISVETLSLELEEKRFQFVQGLMKWVTGVETRLAEMLPNDTEVANFDSVPAPIASVIPKLTLTTGTGDPINSLAVETQKLLRADVVFQSEGDNSLLPCFYPDDFDLSYSPVEDFIYYEEAANIAKALLSVLDWPNASFLELKALGLAFRCGRCHTRYRDHHWGDIIQHYLYEAEEWRRNLESPLIRADRDFTYMFAHDIGLAKPEKPLVRLVPGVQLPDSSGASRRCKLCQSVGLKCRIDGDFIIEHVQDVHLVETPEEGIHYE